MRVSFRWLSEFIDLSFVKNPRELADRLTARGLEVEAIHDFSAGFEQVVTAKILERKPHPQADRLSLCTVSLGSGEPLEIVCGAQNMKAGDVVALAQVGANLPNGLKITASKIRGVLSHGMLCSEQELKLKDVSEGILILPPSTKLGQPLADVLGRKDVAFDIAVPPNRGDCLSHFGIARELAAAFGKKMKRAEVPLVPLEGAPVRVSCDAEGSGPQFLGCAIDGVRVGPSPDWVVRRLEAVGQRSINNVVDATNLVLLEYGHPMHAYDADRLQGGRLAIRLARKGETLPLLDGQTVTLAGHELVIADGAQGERAVGLAGVMGGGNSEVQETSTRLFLECAEFAPTLVRRAASGHSRHTEAAQRFERGVDPEGLHFALSRLAQLVLELAGGRVTGGARAMTATRAKGSPKISISVKPSYFAGFLGVKIDSAQCRAILEGIGCVVSADWTVQVPTHRMDLRIPEDLAEEIGKAIGYDAIPTTVPQLSESPRPFGADAAPRDLSVLDAAKDALAELGLHETIHYAFSSRARLAEFGMKGTVTLRNPMSEEQEVLVPSLLPALIRSAQENERRHFGSEPLAIRLFEIRPTFHLSGDAGADGVSAVSQTDTGVQEHWRLAIACSGPRVQAGLNRDLVEIDFSEFKGLIEGFFQRMGTRGVRLRAAEGMGVYHPVQCAEVWIGKDRAGFFGRLHPRIATALKLRSPLWVCELDWAAVSRQSLSAADARKFKPWSEFPTIERDFALLVKSGIEADRLIQTALKAGKPLAKSARVFDTYQGHQVAEGMTSVAVRVIFSGEGRSLQETEAEQASAAILTQWKKELGVELRV